ncbi:MAG: hypothetical protein ACFFCW_04310 [Candidatus Hodarchaeota archaeon]
MKNDLVSVLLDFFRKEKINIKLENISDSEFWLENSKASVVAKFLVDDKAHEILYDIFSLEFDVHLKEKTLNDVETLDFKAETHKKWKLEEAVEEIWLILDQVKLWAQKHAFKNVKETKLI